MSDAFWYAKMSEGALDEVPRPFANRMLQPWLASLLMRASGCTSDLAFRALGIGALFGFVVAAGRLLYRARHGWRLAALILATPFTVFLFRGYYLPDLPHAALTAAVLLALARRSGWVFPLLMVSGFARESTCLLAAIAGVFAWRDGNRRRAVTFSSSTV